MTVGAISPGESRQLMMAPPTPSWPTLCTPSSAMTTTPNAPNSAGAIIRARIRPMTRVPNRAETASMKIHWSARDTDRRNVRPLCRGRT